MYICGKCGVCVCIYVVIYRSGTWLCINMYIMVCVYAYMCVMWSVYAGTLYISEMRLSALGS